MTPSPELAIIRHLAACTHTSAAEIGIPLRMTATEVCTCIAALDSHRPVGSRQNEATRLPRRVHYVTAEERRKAGTSDARAKRT